jgi:hypothetical protein
MKFFDWPFFLVPFASGVFTISVGALCQPSISVQFVRRWILELKDTFIGLNAFLSLISAGVL